LGVSLAALIMMVIGTGIATRAVANLVGPTPNPSGLTTAIGLPPGFPPSPAGIQVSPAPLGSAQIDRGSLARDRQDQRNHDITQAVIAGLFALSGAVGYALAWRHAKSLFRVTGEREGLGRLPLGYAYLTAGLAALAALVLAPLSASAVFRAIAPGVNGTSGHADGLRKLATFGVLLGLSAWILTSHFRLARMLRSLTNGGEATPPRDDEPQH
jgi:hypothetical protein